MFCRYAHASLSLVLGLLLGAAGSEPLWAKESCSAQSPATATGYIPFLSAGVERRDGDYVVHWSTAQARSVQLQLELDPAGGDVMDAGAPKDVGRWRVRKTIAGTHPFFRLTPDCGAPLVIAARDVSRPHLSNLRDMGGYRTTDGRWVRMGLAYRSNDLSKADAADLHAIAPLDIATVVDMRHETERRQEPDRLPANARYTVADVLANPTDLPVDASKLIKEGRGDELLEKLNRVMVSSPAASQAYASLLRTLADEKDGAVLFHCTAGKDRTGWAGAVLLTLLGVPRDTVYQDYLLSNRYRARDARARVREHGKLFVPLERVERAYLDAAFDEVDRRYGSFAAYLRDGLKLDSNVITQLRRKFLQGQPG